MLLSLVGLGTGEGTPGATQLCDGQSATAEREQKSSSAPSQPLASARYRRALSMKEVSVDFVTSSGFRGLIDSG
jgi:hypothetical protein